MNKHGTHMNQRRRRLRGRAFWRLGGSLALLTVAVIGGGCAGASPEAARPDVPTVSVPVATPTPEATPSPAAMPPTPTAGPERDATVEVHRHLTRPPVEQSVKDPRGRYRALDRPCRGFVPPNTIVPTHGHQGRAVAWGRDGAEIFFSAGVDIYAVAPTGQRLRHVAIVAVDRFGGASTVTGFAVAPDGDRLAYATCEFPSLPEGPYGVDAKPTYAFELARLPVARGAGAPRRLTTNREVDHFPTWSPDGTRIAFLRNRREAVPSQLRSPTALYVMEADGANEREMPHTAGILLHHPPAWAPDGTRLAVARHEPSRGTGLYLIDVESGAETFLAPAVSGATWSPDGSRLAFAQADGDTVAVVTIAADGTDPQRVTTIDRWWPAAWTDRFRQHVPAYARPDPAATWIEDVAWSPDGARILVRAHPESGVVVASVDGQERTLVEVPLELAGESQPIEAFWAAAWAPDGARMALLGLHVDFLERRQPMLMTMAPDGSDPRLLTRGSPARGVPQATGGGAPVGPVGAAACRAGIVVPDPERQPGLVADCEALLALRDALVFDSWRGERGLNWREDLDRPLRSWEGVTLSGTPERVRGLDLSQRRLQGALPAEVGRLSKLESLSVRGNDLTGPIPAVIWQLPNLKQLDLHGNEWTGCLPGDVPKARAARHSLELPLCEQGA